MAKSFEKLIDEIGNLTVVELADLVKELEEKFEVSAAMPVAGGAAAPAVAGAGEAAEEKSAYKVTLQSAGPEKIKNIKALRALNSALSLADAKKAVEEAPTVIAESAPKEEAEKMKTELEAVGAKVELS